MYLKKIYLKNVGPIDELDIDMPFHDPENCKGPKPLILVGQNGSGKSIVLSFIVSYFLSVQQGLYDNPEIEEGHFYKFSTPTYIKNGNNFYYACLDFHTELDCPNNESRYEEIQLLKDKNNLSKEEENSIRSQLPSTSTMNWRELSFMPQPRFRRKISTPEIPHLNLRECFNKNCLLYFPPNRFEEPSWLNQDNLNFKPKFRIKNQITGRRERTILADKLLTDILNWRLGLTLDALLRKEYQNTAYDNLQLQKAHVVHEALGKMIKIIFKKNWTNNFQENILEEDVHVLYRSQNRNYQRLGFSIARASGANLNSGNTKHDVLDFFSLSTGESTLFTIFCAILRDFDLSESNATSLKEISGIVIIDEIDSHLHVDLQYNVLPALIQLFPNIQFILTSHSPLFLLGMNQVFQSNEFQIIELPKNEEIFAHLYSEFKPALQAFKDGKKSFYELRKKIKTFQGLTLLTEGESDKRILEKAWKVLRTSKQCPFNIFSLDGVDNLNNALRLLAQENLKSYPIITLFDNDEKGFGGFDGLDKRYFDKEDNSSGWRLSKSKPLGALLLPVPKNPDRSSYVDAGAKLRFLTIEHYFEDDILKKFKVIETPRPQALNVDRIKKNKKIAFAQSIENLNNFDAFQAFKPLLELIEKKFQLLNNLCPTSTS